jgi:hypothetical protein
MQQEDACVADVFVFRRQNMLTPEEYRRCALEHPSWSCYNDDEIRTI